MMNNKFFLDVDILTDKRLSAIDRIVYFALVTMTDKDKDRLIVKYSEVKRLIGLSKSSIQRSIKYLNRIKLIKKIRKSYGCEYTLNFHHNSVTLTKEIWLKLKF